MTPSQTYFQNARNFNVQNSQINNVGPHGSLVVINNQDAVSTILWAHVAAGAIFDSAERHAAGKCHPGTRKKIIQRITKWIVDNNVTYRVIWLHGPAGGGKSAVEHTMCELLKEQHPESYGASFFFRSGDSDRGNARKLCTTLAYQLALHFPFIRNQINDTLSHDPSLPTKSMETQFLALIGQPLLKCQSLLSHSPIFVIDGLDECADDDGLDTQRSIIALIGKLIVEHNLPLRVMIASRPEFWIRDAFDTAPLHTITEVLSLRDDEDADKDIKVYLVDGFEKIRVENKRVMASVALPWPSEKTIRHFVEQASGQYIYPSTVLRFVGKSSRFLNPQKQLEIITSPGSNHALGFSELDRLYVTILSAYPESERETLKRVLGGLLVGTNTSIITAALGVKPDDIALVLDALSSLVNIEKPKQLLKEHLSDLEPIFGSLIDGRDEISFCHLSFREFLTDETRSGPFYVDLEAIRREIVRQFFDMILDCKLDQNYEIGPHCFVNLYYFRDSGSMAHATFWCLYELFHDKEDLFSQVAERLTSFNPGRRSPDSLLSFMRGLEDIETITNNVSSPATATLLENAIRLAQQKAIHALWLCSTFKITPALVYLTEYKSSVLDRGSFSFHELSTIPGTVDVITTIRQHRHFLLPPSGKFRDIGFGDDEDHALVFQSMNLKAFRDHRPQNGSRMQSEWNAARIFLVHHYLKLVLNTDKYYRNADPMYFLQDYFFDSRETSDICTEEYLQNKTNLCILSLMSELALWTRFQQIHGAWHSDPVIVSILCWFNRQLTHEKSLKLLQAHDKSLQQGMTTVMTFILEQSLLLYLTNFYTMGLCAYESENKELISLQVLSLPQGFNLEGKNGDVYDVWEWGPFLNEVFNDNETKSPINPSCWYPLLASRLLFTLVRFFYGQVHPDFSANYHHYEEFFPYFSRCLPYAEPTPKNLDAIRAIVYLYPQWSRTWIIQNEYWSVMESPNLPEDFWRLIGEFLQKYDRSTLPLEELNLLMAWIESPDHADIATYIMIKQEWRPTPTDTNTDIERTSF